MDRLSDLPDALLVKILSLLPTKQVVSTNAFVKKMAVSLDVCVKTRIQGRRYVPRGEVLAVSLQFFAAAPG